MRALIQAELDEANSHYAQVEQIKRFTILARDFTLEDGELTPSLKLKRNVVYDNYADEFEDLYARVARQPSDQPRRSPTATLGRAADEERGDARVLPGAQLLADLLRRADEGDVLDHRQRDRRGGVVLAAGEVQLLDLRGDVLVAHPGEHLEVEVGAAGAHPAGVEGEERADGVGAALGVVAGDDRSRSR